MVFGACEKDGQISEKWSFSLIEVAVFGLIGRLKLNSQARAIQAPVTPELATRGVFRLSRLSVSSYSKAVKKYTPH